MMSHVLIPIIEAKTSCSFHQRILTLRALERLLSHHDGKILVELYLNYDCDPLSDDNIWEVYISLMKKLLGALSSVLTAQMDEVELPFLGFDLLGDIPITTQHLHPYTTQQVRDMNASDGDSKALKKYALNLLVHGILQPLVAWLDRPQELEPPKQDDIEEDDVSQFTNQKLAKQNLSEGIKRFNMKFKKGIKFLIDTKCILSRSHEDIATFLFKTEGLDKGMIGEYLGEGYIII